MKKIILIFLVIALGLTMFTSCSNQNKTIGEKPVLDFESSDQSDSANPANPSATAKANTNSGGNNTPIPQPDIQTVDNSGAMRIILPRDQWNQFSEEDVDNWEAYIMDKYNFEIDIVTVSKDYETSMEAYIASLKKEASQGGFIYTTDLPTLNALADSGLIEPVNNYIGKVERYNVLPDEIVMKLSDSGGNMWGFPLSDRIYANSPDRTYSTRWLEAANMEVPRTIEEFYQFAMFVSQTDLDGNGEYDSYVASYSDYLWLYDLGDIFNAFGCFYYGQSPVAYNPIKGLYENCIFNENFIEAITFVKLLNDEGVLFRQPTSTSVGIEDSALEAYQIAAATRFENQEIIEGGVTIGNYLEGINTENLSETRFAGSCLAILSGTPNVPESITGLMNLLTSDPNSRMDFAYGIKNEHYEEEDEYFNINTVDAMGNSKRKRMDIQIYLSDMGFSEKYTVNNGVDFRKENEEFYEMLTTAHEEKEEISDSVKYSIPLEAYDSRLDTLRNTTYRSTRDFIGTVMSGNTEIEDAIEVYRNRLDALKIFDIIDSMNMELLNN